MKICPKCSSEHEKDGIFCSRICANSRGPRSEAFKTSVREKLSGRVRDDTAQATITCRICGKPSEFRTSRSKRQSCGSIECLSVLRKIAGSSGGKKAANATVKRSSDEIKLFELCSSHFENVDSNAILIDGWDADVVIRDIKTAVLWNGPWHYRDMGFSNHSLIQVQTRDKIKIKKFSEAGWNVLVFEDRHWTPESAFRHIIG